MQELLLNVPHIVLGCIFSFQTVILRDRDSAITEVFDVDADQNVYLLLVSY